MAWLEFAELLSAKEDPVQTGELERKVPPGAFTNTVKVSRIVPQPGTIAVTM